MINRTTSSLETPVTAAEQRAVSDPPVLRGHIPFLGHVGAMVKDPLALLLQAEALGPVVTVRLGVRKAYILSDPNLVRDVLVNDADSYRRGRHFEKARAVAGNGIITTSGEVHHAQRVAVLPAFSRAALKSYLAGLVETVDRELETWPLGKAPDPRPLFLTLTTKVAARALFGTQLSPESIGVVEAALPVLTQGVAFRVADPTNLYGYVPSPSNMQFRRHMRRLNQLIRDLVEERLRAPESHADLLSTILESVRDKDLSNAEKYQRVRDDVVSLLLSSTETTALTLAWATYELGRQPHLQSTLREESRQALMGEVVTHEGLRQLDFTRRVVKETLRLYPPTYFLSRETARPVTVAGFHLPQGSLVLYSLFVQHRNLALFQHPSAFNPDRWLPGNLSAEAEAAYMPFGVGAHRCVGEGFAMNEATTALALLMRARQVEMVDGGQARMRGTVTLAPRNLRISLSRVS